ncbi:MAG TPA: hypothetical protein VF532_16520 [Candidatus Angelobacter sp.]
MKLILVCAVTSFSLPLTSASQSGPEAKPANKPAVVGDWHGTSLCLVKPSACHDEEALYHVKTAPEKPGGLAMQADKIVDGKPESMGDADCSFDAAKKLLHCDLGRSTIELTLEGDRLEGAMFLRDKTRWREIKLTRVKS